MVYPHTSKLWKQLINTTDMGATKREYERLAQEGLLNPHEAMIRDAEMAEQEFYGYTAAELDKVRENEAESLTEPNWSNRERTPEENEVIDLMYSIFKPF